MGWLGMIGNFIGSVASMIATVIGNIGSAIGTGLKAVIGTVTTILEKFETYVPKLVNFVGTLLNAIGVLQPNEKIQDFGERVLQAQERGIQLDDMEDFDAYMAQLRSFELDPKIATKRSELVQMAAAMTVGAVALARRYDLAPETAAHVYLLSLVNDRFFTPERVLALLADRVILPSLQDYLEGRLSPDQGLRLAQQLLELERQHHPAAELATLRAELDASRQAYDSLRAQLANGAQGGSYA